MTLSATESNYPSRQPLLRAQGLSRSYGPVAALNDVSIDFFAGEVHAIVGENGAGKTTLMRQLAGEEQPDSGQILLGGRVVELKDPATAKSCGIVVVHQQFQLVNTMTVAENMFLGDTPMRASFGPLSVVDFKAMTQNAVENLARFDLGHRAQDTVGALTVGERQLVEISRAMRGNARLFILDEPTASLGSVETRELFRHVAALREAGAAIILIAHNIDEVLELSDRISVLRNGRVVMTEHRSVMNYESIVRAMVGKELEQGFPKAQTTPGETMLRVDGYASRIDGASHAINVRQSEIVGIPTYVGAAVDRLLDGIAGLNDAKGCRINVNGSALPAGRVDASIAAGVCMIPGDALAEGLIPNFSIEDNILLPNLKKFQRVGVVWRSKLRTTVDALIRELDIRPADPTANVMNLSGGNRQKVVIAKWLASGARVMLMNDPTKAVDVGAKAEIYRLLGNIVAQGGGHSVGVVRHR
ncbi:MAG: sugar ABC transporter ATP-binding protein [Bradyrhizobium sp.]